MSESTEATYHALILNVMVAMMKADGDVDAREVAQICDLCDEVVGYRLGDAFKERAINAVRFSRSEVLELVRKYEGRLDEREHRSILDAGLRVLRADKRMDPREKRFLADVRSALRLETDEEDARSD